MAGHFRSEMGRPGQAGRLREADRLEQARRPAHPLLLGHGGLSQDASTLPKPKPPPATACLLDLGAVEVMARVQAQRQGLRHRLEAALRVDITEAVRAGKNELEIAVVNLWINRMIGDEQLPEDGNWKDFETLLEWPEWFKTGKPRPSGRYTFTSCRHYTEGFSAGALGPAGAGDDPKRIKPDLR